MGKISKGGGFGACQKFWSTYLLDFYHYRLSKSVGIKNNVQRFNIFSKANNTKIYALLLHFAKCRDSRVKVLRNCPN